jgi:hypothetical protein
VLTSANWKQLAGFLKYDGTPTAAACQSAGIEDSVRPNGTRSLSSNAASDISDEISFLMTCQYSQMMSWRQVRQFLVTPKSLREQVCQCHLLQVLALLVAEENGEP